MATRAWQRKRIEREFMEQVRATVPSRYTTVRCYNLTRLSGPDHDAPTCIGTTDPSRCLCPCHDAQAST